MRSLATLATLLLGLAILSWAPAAKADCPHNGDDVHQHCGSGTSGSTPYKFAGYSSSAYLLTGDIGLPPLYAAERGK